MSGQFSGERLIFSINGVGTTGYPHAKEWSWTPYLTPRIKFNSKWIKDLTVRAKAVKLLGENIDINLCDFGLDNDFWDMTPKAQQ